MLAGLPAEFVVVAAVVLGLLVGSFLNVVIYRLPIMMERQWAAEIAVAQADAQGAAAQPSSYTVEPEADTFNLVVPRSRCPHCGHQVRWYENLPVLSWLALRGRCSACQGGISVRYPLVEAATGLLFGYCAWRWGASWTAIGWCGFSAAVVALAMIDWDTTLLPDSITLPLLWAGLVFSALQWTELPLTDAVWGAVGGYMSLWLVYWGFKLLTGKEGMGFGDFKLFAALGAWFGWQALIPLILIASITGAIVGLAMKLRSGLRPGGYVPFGPFLGLAGLIGMVASPPALLRAAGL
ncbi:A24 family peptidase [Xylophilus sp. GOD-11R]|uniref:prepilin peptidase n=1 Tax=Xylophilus sp. GOD-11R TaxID=3089814 RepID=UPI00298D5EDC|nr:A24 family peptidase [Xylophilus sp. GOD-11R]WPB57661.1 A24 family peptidase [Xylophilus sp. GOD-11R]